MSISILQEPVTVQTAYNDLIYKVSSTNSAQDNFKFVADIIVGGQSFRQAIFPDPIDDTGVFNVSSVVRNYVTEDIDKDTFGFQENVNSQALVSVRFGEEYGDSSSGTTVFPNMIESSETLAWNGVIDFLPAANFIKGDFVMSTGDTTNFLTTMPTSGVIRDSEDAWLYALSEASGTIFHAQIVTYDSANTILQTVKVNNPFEAISSSNSKYVRFGCGTNNLNSIPSSGITNGGAQAIITDSVVRYDITFIQFDDTEVSNTHSFLIDNTCTKNEVFRLHFLNELGGYDSYSFIRASRNTIGINRTGYKKLIGGNTSSTTFGYSAKDRARTTFETEVHETINIKSDWVSEATSDWLEQLLTSPDVYVDDATHGLVPIQILNTSYNKRKEVTDKLWNIDVQFRFSFDKFRQSR